MTHAFTSVYLPHNDFFHNATERAFLMYYSHWIVIWTLPTLFSLNLFVITFNSAFLSLLAAESATFCPGQSGFFDFDFQDMFETIVLGISISPIRACGSPSLYNLIISCVVSIPISLLLHLKLQISQGNLSKR